MRPLFTSVHEMQSAPGRPSFRFARSVVHHDVKLRREDQDADAGEHAVDDGGRYGPEQLADPERSGSELNDAGRHNERPQHF